MTNPALKHLVKIGYAKDVEARRKQLSNNTNIPDKYKVYATYETSEYLSDQILHEMIDKLNPRLRYKEDREFYKMEPQEAFDLLKAIAIISGTKSKLMRNDITKKKVPRSPVSFGYYGFPNEPKRPKNPFEIRW